MEKKNLTFVRFLKRLIYFPTWILIIASYVLITCGPFAIFWLITGSSMYTWWTEDVIEEITNWFDIELVEDDDGYY